MSLRYNGSLISLAKTLRKASTPQEKRLWYDFLSTYPVRFQRQKVIDNYIVDFYCHAAKLVIEIDGSQHYTENGLQMDQIRTDTLNRFGLTVLRLTNTQINHKFRDVCEHIDHIVANTLNNH